MLPLATVDLTLHIIGNILVHLLDFAKQTSSLRRDFEATIYSLINDSLQPFPLIHQVIEEFHILLD